MTTEKELNSQKVTQNDPIERAIKGLIKVSLKNNNLVCPKCGKEYHSPIVIKTIREQAISNFAEKIKEYHKKKKELSNDVYSKGDQTYAEYEAILRCLIDEDIFIDKLVEEQSSGEKK